MRRPRARTRFGFGGRQALARDRLRSCQFTSVEMVLLCSRAGLGDARKHSAAACSRRTWFSICRSNASIGTRLRRPRARPEWSAKNRALAGRELARLPARRRVLARGRAKGQARDGQPEEAQNSSHQQHFHMRVSFSRPARGTPGANPRKYADFARVAAPDYLTKCQ